MSDPVNPEYINAPWANQIDGLTDAAMVVDYPHHELHSGSAFYAEFIELALGAGSSVEVVIQTPDSDAQAHMVVGFGADAEATLEFYEDVTFVAAGTPVVVQNRNRASTKTATVTVTHTPTTLDVSGSVAEKLFTKIVGSTGANPTQSSGGVAGTRDEWLLAFNTVYAAVLTNDSGTDAKVAVDLGWYEHTQTAQVYTTKWNRSTRRRAT